MSTAAGWYPDPQSPADLRYWDGTTWTGERRPAEAPAAEPIRTTIPASTPGSTGTRPALLWKDAGKLQETGGAVAAVGTLVFVLSLLATIFLVFASLDDSGTSSDFGASSSDDDYAFIGALLVGAPGIVGGILLAGLGQLMRVVAHYTRWRVAEVYGAASMDA